MIGVCLVVVCFANAFTGISAEENNSTFLEWFTNSTESNVPSLPLVHLDKKSYYIESILKGNYFQAQQFCTYHGMKLASISSKAENDFLENQIRKLGINDLHFWTSASSLPGGKRWIWMSTGRPMIYTNWHPGEPNNVKNSKEDCMEMRIFERGLTWNDLVCTSELYFVCEISWPRDCFKLIQEIIHTKTESPLVTQVRYSCLQFYESNKEGHKNRLYVSLETGVSRKEHHADPDLKSLCLATHNDSRNIKAFYL